MDRQDHRHPYWREDHNDEEPDMHPFQDRHRTFADRVERFLMQVVILTLIALVLVQTLEIIPPVRKFANLVEGLEGVPAQDYLAWTQPATNSNSLTATERAIPSGASAIAPASVTVVLISHRTAPEARLLVDGKSAGNFETGRVTAKVLPGQLLTLDGSRVEESLTFRVVGALGLTSPSLGSSVTTQSNERVLGVVTR